MQEEPTPEPAETPFVAEAAGDVGKGLLIGLGLLWLAVSVYVYLSEEPAAVWAVAGVAVGGCSLFIAISEKREENRARQLANAYARIKIEASAVIEADSAASRARAQVALGEAFTNAGRIGAPSPISMLSDEPVVKVEEAVGVIHADAAYRRGIAEQRERRKELLSNVFGVVGILSFVVAVIALILTL